MKVIKTSLPGVLVLEPEIFRDERGLFYESYSKKKFDDALQLNINFVQDNISESSSNVLRGLHYQIKNPQAKLVQVISGEIFDVAVDLRISSATFGKWFGVNLSSNNKRQLWIPEGFAHGFYTISNKVIFSYKVTNFYSPNDERCILWNDKNLNIDWPIKNTPNVSLKDKQGKFLYDSELYN